MRLGAPYMKSANMRSDWLPIWRFDETDLPYEPDTQLMDGTWRGNMSDGEQARSPSFDEAKRSSQG